MNRRAFLTILFIIFAHSLSFAQELSCPAVSNNEHGVYRTILKKSKQVIWQAEWSAHREAAKEGPGVIRINETGYGKYNDAQEPMSWKMEFNFTAETPPRVLNATRAVISEDGRESRKNSKELDYENRKLIFREFTEEKLVKDKTLDFPNSRVYPADALAILLRGYDFDKGRPLKFHVFSNKGKLYEIKIKAVKTEEVEVPFGVFQGYKLEFILSEGLLSKVIGYFLPKTYIWYSVEEPHIWLKYEGLESGLGSPYVTMELISLTSQ